MSLNKVDKTTGNLSLIAGGVLYADSPIGTILPYGGTEAPSGWMLCQGQAVSRTNYADLFAVIGTSFGTGDGSTTFNLPDLRGEFLRGAGTNSHTDQGNGGTVGQHQDATVIPDIEAYNGDTSTPNTTISSGTSGTSKGSVQNHDSKVVVQNAWINRLTGTKDSGDTNFDKYWAMRTVRPTNTSVNYIIKAMQVSVPTDIEAGVRSIISVSEMPMDVDPTSAEIDSYPAGAMWLETDD